MSVLAKTKEVLAEAERLNPQLNNFLSIEHEASLEKAAYLDSVPAERPMHGRAIAVKDNICTRGMRTSCGSRILENYKAHYDATAVERLNAAHAKQLLTYLRLTKRPLGLLINFGGATLKEGLRRIVNGHTSFASSRLRVNQ